MRAAIVVLSIVSLSAALNWKSVCKTSDGWHYIVDGRNASVIPSCSLCLTRWQCVAWGYHIDSVEEKGWGEFKVQSNPAMSPEDQSFAAGYLEGALMTIRIRQSYVNIASYLFARFNGSIPHSLGAFMAEQMEWSRSQARKYAKQDQYWHQVMALSATGCSSEMLSLLQIHVGAMSPGRDVPVFSRSRSPSFFTNSTVLSAAMSNSTTPTLCAAPLHLT